MELNYACADCGTERADMKTCENCKSFRVVLISVLKLFGDDWKQKIQEKTNGFH